MPVAVGAYKPRLTLRIVWHSDYASGQLLAEHVYSRLCRDIKHPVSRGFGIPVLFHSGSSVAEARLHDFVPLDDSTSTVVVALVDDSIRGDVAWIECLSDVSSQVSTAGKHHLFIPVACEERAYSVVRSANFVRLYKTPDKDRPEKLVAVLTHELARALLGKASDVITASFGVLEKSLAPVKLFISHAKRDGVGIAEQLRDYVHQHLPEATFFDSNDISPGSDFGREIQANVAESALVIIHTDQYSAREWCRKEVLYAKQYGCPMVVVDWVQDGEDRRFPYLGNAPTIRWRPTNPQRCELVVDAAVREVLRHVYFLEHSKTLKAAGLVPPGCVEIGTAPEVLTYLNLVKAGRCDWSKNSVVLYPDPPLGDEEVQVMQTLNKNLTLTTPTTSGAHRSAGSAPPFKGRLIGISISNSPNLASRGMSIQHLEDAMVEIARYLLAQGASLAYGGDLRAGGFTEILFELVRSHNEAGTQERIHDFLAWPIHLKLDMAQYREYLDEARFYKLPPPDDLGANENDFLEPDTAEGRYAWARSLTAMRERMNGLIRARILLGGQLLGFKGKYPGVLEEVLLALKAGMPLFLIGGFGGCTEAVIEILRGCDSPGLTEDFHKESDPLYAGLIERYSADAHRVMNVTAINYESETKFLRAKGIAGLNNGLSVAENETLFGTTNLPHIVYLILKGITGTIV